ncbi:MAG TPA: heme exporter protein CcmD [Ramlibacter sp.]|jgi:heme exporter protein D|nr:heme exporter protein CcmD [Ramlibacter sp.]
MNWHSPSEFFAMGGYALYVWGAFGACAVALALEPFLVSRRRRAIVGSLRRHARADKMEQEVQ